MSTRRIAAVSKQELERRWGGIRKEMRERDIDALVMMGTDNFLGGYIRWFTDAPIAYRTVVVFHKEDLMTVVEHGAAGEVRRLDGRDENHPGVGELITVAEFPSIHYTQDHEARELVKALRRRGTRSIALVNGPAMSFDFVETLKQGLSGQAVFGDGTEFVDQCKAIKSAEELSFIQRTAAMQDACFQRVLREVRPGMRDVEVAALMQHEGRLHGGEIGWLLAGSAPVGDKAFFQPDCRQGRVIREGDHFSVLIENTGPGGYFLELVRTVMVGKAPAELVDTFALVKEAQEHTLSLCKPGTPSKAIFAAHNDFMQKLGYPAERRLYAHGQGYDMVERPLIRDDETMSIQDGMCLTVHPSIATPRLWMTITDNYMIGPHGAGDCLHKTEKRVFEI